jgi:hypothetical protein
LSLETIEFATERIELEGVGEGWGGCGESEACEEEPKASREYGADHKMGVGQERWPWLSVLGEGERRSESEWELSKDGEGKASAKEGSLSGLSIVI